MSGNNEAMEYRNLGKSGLKVSALSFGTWVTFGDQIDDEPAHAVMAAAYDAGVNFFDNAEGYAQGESESMMGRVIAGSSWKRSSLVVSTKIFWGGTGPNSQGLSRKHLHEGTEASLERLQLDYVDLLFCHRPDAETPIEETVRALSNLVDRGLALYWGTSEWGAGQIREAYDVARREHLIPPTMEQPQYNLFVRDKVEAEYARLYDDIGLGLTTWSPLSSGLLTGKHNDGIDEDSRAGLESYKWLRGMFESDMGRRQMETIKALQPIADDLGCTMAQMAIAWCLTNPRVSTVITGASRPAQVTENMAALEVVEALTPEVRERIEGVVDNKPGAEERFRN